MPGVYLASRIIEVVKKKPFPEMVNKRGVPFGPTWLTRTLGFDRLERFVKIKTTRSKTSPHTFFQIQINRIAVLFLGNQILALKVD